MSDKINRRKFLKKAAIGLIGLEAGYLLYDALHGNEQTENNGGLFNAGKLHQLEKNRLYPFASGKFYLSVMEDGGLLAISAKCTHLGCIVQSKGNEFQCPCHASVFDRHGLVKSPPATRALDIFPITIKNGSILVDTRHPIRRKKFDKSQLTYA
jgi:nitrite reductase/ring-hydroxylating ferredoxin subunit